jgi:hypothetical protein
MEHIGPITNSKKKIMNRCEIWINPAQKIRVSETVSIINMENDVAVFKI